MCLDNTQNFDDSFLNSKIKPENSTILDRENIKSTVVANKLNSESSRNSESENKFIH